MTSSTRMLLKGLSPAQALDLHRHLKHGGSEIPAKPRNPNALGSLGSEAELSLEVSSNAIRALWDWAQQQPGDHFTYVAEIHRADGNPTIHEIRIDKDAHPSKKAIREILEILNQ